MIGQVHILGLLVLPKCVGSLLCVLWMYYQDYPLQQGPSVHLARGAAFALYKQRGFPELFSHPRPKFESRSFHFFSFFLLHFQCVIACDLRCEMRSGFSLGCVIACDLVCDICLMHNAQCAYVYQSGCVRFLCKHIRNSYVNLTIEFKNHLI